jgi:hypothetical protein
MPAATTKSDLIAATEKEWAKLNAMLAGIPAELAERPFEEGATIKDIASHRDHWIGLFFQWLEEGEAAQMPDHGVKWSELKPYNRELRSKYAALDWETARDRLRHSHARLMAWIRDADEATLYGGPMPGGTGWTTGRYAEAAGPSHYRSAAKFIRKCLREAEAP